jgi:hypothetical protein
MFFFKIIVSLRLAKTIRVDTLVTSIDDYYKTYSIFKHSNRAKIHLMSTHKLPDLKTYGPQHIDKFQNPLDGVYYPNQLSPSMGWKGGSVGMDSKDFFFDPFAVDTEEKLISEEFTPIVNDADSTLVLSKFLFLNPFYTSPTRINQVIANQCEKPAWLNKAQFFTFSSMRAYPNQQYRKLCIALKDKNLPLERKEVQLLLQTTLYHVGELEWLNSKMTLAWRGFIVSINLKQLKTYE